MMVICASFYYYTSPRGRAEVARSTLPRSNLRRVVIPCCVALARGPNVNSGVSRSYQYSPKVSPILQGREVRTPAVC